MTQAFAADSFGICDYLSWSRLDRHELIGSGESTEPPAKQKMVAQFVHYHRVRHHFFSSRDPCGLVETKNCLLCFVQPSSQPSKTLVFLNAAICCGFVPRYSFPELASG